VPTICGAELRLLGRLGRALLSRRPERPAA
jgi:hypothetical protein